MDIPRAKAIVAMYRDPRYTVSQIAAHFGLSANRVRAILRQAGEPRRDFIVRSEEGLVRLRQAIARRSARFRERPEVRKALALVRNGYSYGEAAKKCSLTRNMVAGAVWRANRREQGRGAR